MRDDVGDTMRKVWCNGRRDAEEAYMVARISVLRNSPVSAYRLT
jgi:hypothetical protein